MVACTRRNLFSSQLDHIPKTLMKIIQDNLCKKFEKAYLKANRYIFRKSKNQDYSGQSCNHSKAYRFQETSDMIFHQFPLPCSSLISSISLISPLRPHMNCECKIKILKVRADVVVFGSAESTSSTICDFSRLKEN